MTATEHRKITKACDILFGDKFKSDIDTFQYIQVSGIKSAYRQKVKTCHPDIFTGSGSDNMSSNEFCRLKSAYDYLLKVKKFKSVPAAESRSAEYKNIRIPNRKLRIGEYLYYSGAISWDDLINALVWQKRSEMRIGMYFLEKNILKSQELALKIVKMNLHNRRVKV